MPMASQFSRRPPPIAELLVSHPYHLPHMLPPTSLGLGLGLGLTLTLTLNPNPNPNQPHPPHARQPP